MKEERVLAIICIFYEANKLNRISLKDEPELWVALLNINNAKENCRPWFIADLLKIDEREWFKNKNLKIGGEVFEYQWIDNKTKEEWKGKFIGYPLCNMTDKETVKKSILDKLFL